MPGPAPAGLPFPKRPAHGARRRASGAFKIGMDLEHLAGRGRSREDEDPVPMMAPMPKRGQRPRRAISAGGAPAFPFRPASRSMLFVRQSCTAYAGSPH